MRLLSLTLILTLTINIACQSKTSPRSKIDSLIIGGIEFIKIPAGSFEMGDNSEVSSENERPVHRVTIKSFLIARTEITLKQWKMFLSDSGYPSGRSTAPGDEHPVVSISWEDTQAFCKWFSEKYKLKMRLPTEAEWEFAARGGLERKQYPNGNTINPADANYSSKSSVAVASYPPNGYGLYDMAGNVFEWVADWYDKDYYHISPANNPTGPGTETGKLQRRVDRGGGWCMDSNMLRVSARHSGPGSWDEGGTATCLGFRPVIEIVTENKQ